MFELIIANELIILW